MAYLLDTSAAILLRDDDPSAKAAFAALEKLPALSAITKVELEGGVYVRPEMMAQRRRRLDALLAALNVVDFDSDMATVYGQIVQSMGFSRRKIIDRMIAATALAQRRVLITANGADFEEIEGLQVDVWTS